MTAVRTDIRLDTTAAARSRRDVPGWVGGAGALGFTATVVAQNILRAGGPATDASPRDVLTYYADHRAITFVLATTFAMGAIAMAMFLGGTMRRLLAGGRLGWTVVGSVGALGIMAVFAVVVGADQALSVLATHNTPDLGAVEALWALHNSVFTVLDASIAIALIGLAKAGVAGGTTPHLFERLAPAGAGLLLVACAAGPAIAAGDAMPLFGMGGLGFLVWLGFLVSTGLRLVRSERVEA
jgi:hypothetical protein